MTAQCVAGTHQAQGRTKGQLYFDGWSNFKRLKNNDPPFVHTYSSPVKIKLSPEASLIYQQCSMQAVLAPAKHMLTVYSGALCSTYFCCSLVHQ